MNNGKRHNRIGGGANKPRLATKTRLPDKQMPIEGVYKNVALTHIMTSLIGSVVSVHVKNGKIYEGILKTFSPKMEIVLSAAHLVEDIGAKGDSLPTLDTLIEHIIFPMDHVVHMDAPSADLGFGEQRDGFTDGAISRYNGHGTEKDLKELQPWQADAEVEDIRLDDSSGSGWAAEEMFKRNEQNFNVKSVYCDDLEQYTTPLQKGDSAEWQEREKKAEKIAAEIENNDQSQRRYEAENEDCIDEEEKFSAVVRPGRHVPAPTIQFGTAPAGLNSSSGRYVAPHHRDRGTVNQNHVRPYRLADQPDSVKANGKLDDKKMAAGSADSRQSKAVSSESVTFSPPTGKPDSKVNISPSAEKEEARKLKEFGEKFKLADTIKPLAKSAAPVDEADVKPAAATSTASAPPAPAAPTASSAPAPPSGNSASSASSAASGAGSGPGAVPATTTPSAIAASSAGTSVSETVEAGQQKEAVDSSEKQEKDVPKVVSSLNPNAPAFQPRQPAPAAPQPGNYVIPSAPAHNPPRSNKKATVSVRGNGPHHQHHPAQMSDQFTPAHVQAATGPPFITNQYAGYVNYPYAQFPMLPMQAPLTPRTNQEMGQGQHFAYGMPQGVMQPHMPYGSQGSQPMLQPNGIHVQPMPQPTPPPQLPQGSGVPGSVGSPANPQQVMQHGGGGGGAAVASQQQPAQQPTALAAQGVLPQQQYGAYQGQAAAGAALGHPPLQPSPQSSAASPLAAAPVAYAGGQYYQYQPIAYSGMAAQPPHGSVHHQAVQQPLMFYQMSGQQHQHQALFHAPMQGMSMMGAGPPTGQGGSPMYMQQPIAAVPVHHQMQSYQQQQQP